MRCELCSTEHEGRVCGSCDLVAQRIYRVRLRRTVDGWHGRGLLDDDVHVRLRDDIAEREAALKPLTTKAPPTKATPDVAKTPPPAPVPKPPRPPAYALPAPPVSAPQLAAVGQFVQERIGWIVGVGLTLVGSVYLVGTIWSDLSADWRFGMVNVFLAAYALGFYGLAERLGRVDNGATARNWLLAVSAALIPVQAMAAGMHPVLLPLAALHLWLAGRTVGVLAPRIRWVYPAFALTVPLLSFPVASIVALVGLWRLLTVPQRSRAGMGLLAWGLAFHAFIGPAGAPAIVTALAALGVLYADAALGRWKRVARVGLSGPRGVVALLLAGTSMLLTVPYWLPAMRPWGLEPAVAYLLLAGFFAGAAVAWRRPVLVYPSLASVLAFLMAVPGLFGDLAAMLQAGAASALGYGSDPLPLAWYSLTLLPFLALLRFVKVPRLRQQQALQLAVDRFAVGLSGVLLVVAHTQAGDLRPAVLALPLYALLYRRVALVGLLVWAVDLGLWLHSPLWTGLILVASSYLRAPRELVVTGDGIAEQRGSSWETTGLATVGLGVLVLWLVDWLAPVSAWHAALGLTGLSALLAVVPARGSQRVAQDLWAHVALFAAIVARLWLHDPERGLIALPLGVIVLWYMKRSEGAWPYGVLLVGGLVEGLVRRALPVVELPWLGVAGVALTGALAFVPRPAWLKQGLRPARWIALGLVPLAAVLVVGLHELPAGAVLVGILAPVVPPVAGWTLLALAPAAPAPILALVLVGMGWFGSPLQRWTAGFLALGTGLLLGPVSLGLWPLAAAVVLAMRHLSSEISGGVGLVWVLLALCAGVGPGIEGYLLALTVGGLALHRLAVGRFAVGLATVGWLGWSLVLALSGSYGLVAVGLLVGSAVLVGWSDLRLGLLGRVVLPWAGFAALRAAGLPVEMALWALLALPLGSRDGWGAGVLAGLALLQLDSPLFLVAAGGVGALTVPWLAWLGLGAGVVSATAQLPMAPWTAVVWGTWALAVAGMLGTTREETDWRWALPVGLVSLFGIGTWLGHVELGVLALVAGASVALLKRTTVPAFARESLTLPLLAVSTLQLAVPAVDAPPAWLGVLVAAVFAVASGAGWLQLLVLPVLAWLPSLVAPWTLVWPLGLAAATLVDRRLLPVATAGAALAWIAAPATAGLSFAVVGLCWLREKRAPVEVTLVHLWIAASVLTHRPDLVALGVLGLSLGLHRRTAAIAFQGLALACTFVTGGVGTVPALWVVGGWLGLQYVHHERQADLLGSLVLLDAGALWLAANQGWTEPLAWIGPVALSVLVGAQLLRASLHPNTVALLRYGAAGSVYLTSFAQVVVDPVHTLVLLVLALAGMAAGGWLRVRAYVYLGAGFTGAALLTNAIRWGLAHSGFWALYLTVLGLAVLGGMVVLTLYRERILGMRDALRAWE